MNENIGIFSVLCYPMEVKVPFGRKFFKSFWPLLPTGQAGPDFRSLSWNFLSSYLAGHLKPVLTKVPEIFCPQYPLEEKMPFVQKNLNFLIAQVGHESGEKDKKISTHHGDGCLNVITLQNVIISK